MLVVCTRGWKNSTMQWSAKGPSRIASLCPVTPQDSERRAMTPWPALIGVQNYIELLAPSPIVLYPFCKVQEKTTRELGWGRDVITLSYCYKALPNASHSSGSEPRETAPLPWWRRAWGRKQTGPTWRDRRSGQTIPASSSVGPAIIGNPTWTGVEPQVTHVYS